MPTRECELFICMGVALIWSAHQSVRVCVTPLPTYPVLPPLRWLVSIHKFKAKINGPWDEAVPHLPTSPQWRG